MASDMKCPSCGGTLTFDPGWDRLVCGFCGYKKQIPELVSKIVVPEEDFDAANKLASRDWKMEKQIVHCNSCGAETVNSKLQFSGTCPFCGSSNILPIDDRNEILAPNGIIPFKIREKRAQFIFKEWLGNRSLAPEKLSKEADLSEFRGLYIPYFTFDCETKSIYSGKYGSDATHCWTVENKEFDKFIDDFPVVASKKLTEDRLLMSVANYRTRDARPYTPSALAGFPAEHYSITLGEAWNIAMNEMMSYLRLEAYHLENARIQSNVNLTSSYRNLKYKYLLVPMWVNSFEYDGKRYMIVINGQTGEIAGQWPRSFDTLVKRALEIFF